MRSVRFDYALDYVQEREQFGKPIIEFQAVQLQIAQMKMKLRCGEASFVSGSQ